MEIKINAEHICTFNSMSHWINKGRSWFSGLDPADKLVCIDQAGNCLTCGKDFRLAEEAGTYPVNAYRLVRPSETVTKILDDHEFDFKEQLPPRYKSWSELWIEAKNSGHANKYGFSVYTGNANLGIIHQWNYRTEFVRNMAEKEISE